MDNIVQKTSIDGLVLVKRPTIADDRGFFREPARIMDIETASGIDFHIKQMNHARSSKNTLRGIHIAPWSKLVYVTRGRVQSVVVDFRKDSRTFGKHESFMIGDENRSSVFIPKGMGNSYLVLSEEADYVYLTDEEWAPNREYGIAWNDESLGIKWEIEGKPMLSEKDQVNPLMSAVFAQ